MREKVMPNADRKTVTAREVLVLDSSTFIEEIGLMSRDGSALKHYLYSRGTQLVVPAVVAEECERHLTKRAMGKKKRVLDELEWLGRFCGGVGGWSAPGADVIQERALFLATGDGLGAILLPESDVVRTRARHRDQAERPPSHFKAGLVDCTIWEQCLDLLANHDVVLVSADKDFRGHRNSEELHPQLLAEAEEVKGKRKLTFHRSVESLLSDLKSEISPIPDNLVFAFIYDALGDVVQELESNSGCRPTATGDVKQTRLTTDQAEVIEVRLEVEDKWEGADRKTVMDFYLTGSCHYHFTEERLADLNAGNVRLTTTQPDGSLLAVKGSYVNVGAHFYARPRPIEPSPATLP